MGRAAQGAAGEMRLEKLRLEIALEEITEAHRPKMGQFCARTGRDHRLGGERAFQAQVPLPGHQRQRKARCGPRGARGATHGRTQLEETFGVAARAGKKRVRRHAVVGRKNEGRLVRRQRVGRMHRHHAIAVTRKAEISHDPRIKARLGASLG